MAYFRALRLRRLHAAHGLIAMATKGRIVLISIAVAATIAAPITVTASREPVSVALSGTAITVIDNRAIQTLRLPLVKDYLTLSPSVAVAQTGALGNQVQVRIRGAEANQTLTLIDGIDVTDPASSGEFRYETLLADGISRIEVLRGPQSALWGSQAIGGVINVITREAPRAGAALFGEAEGGSLGTVRGGIGGGYGQDDTGVTGQASYVRAAGYDVSGTGGDRDGYENISLNAKARAKPSETTNVSIVARFVSANSQFDGDLGADGRPTDRPLETRIRQFAIRGEASIALLDARWTHQVAGLLVDTANINRDGDIFENRADGGRYRFTYQTSLALASGSARHRFTGVVEHDRERFDTRDEIFGGGTDQTASRLKTSLIGEYRLDVADWLGGGVALRHDFNNRFADATTVRATAAVKPGAGFVVHGSYGEGVVAPTFTELFGFFPGSFVGNPDVVPERSQGWDIGAGWSNASLSLDVTWFNADLTDEIISVFNPDFTASVANATGRSRREGLEVSAGARLADGLVLAATYAYLDASDQRVADGRQSREIRRPRHSGSVTATYTGKLFDLGASAAITGDRDDQDFSTFPATRVNLPAYVRATLGGAWHLSKRLDITARIENIGDVRAQDVLGFRGPGITAQGGVRLRL
jgi:vitamin B12 transporter